MGGVHPLVGGVLNVIEVTQTQFTHIDGLEAVQRVVFAHLPEIARYTATMYRRHMEIFPEGQFAAILSENGATTIVGGTTTFRTSDFNHVRRPFDAAAAWLEDHDPEGEWLYGVDMSVHPDYRRRGIASLLYGARAALVQRLNLRGEVAAGLLSGYHRYRSEVSIEQYYQQVAAGQRVDPTVSMQMRVGFVVVELLQDYIDDPASGNATALIVRENPHYQTR
jgi:GNAT superfamily N-acetyltransferase